jgi:ParB/RepB/Spo0J family partition protein
MNATETMQSNGFKHIPLAKLHSNPNQPRQVWDEGDDEEGKTKLERLADSIKAEGILQPLVVTPRNGGFVIICGERRYRAAKLAKLTQVPCIVREGIDDKSMLELAITENLQREGLTAIDEAKAVKALMDQCGYTQTSVGKRLGLSVAAVNIKLSLLSLSPELQKEIRKGELSETQGREIARAVNKVEPAKRPEAMKAIKDRIDKAKTTKGRLNTKDVKTVAKTTAEHVRTGASTVKGTPKPPVRVFPPNPKEKAHGKKFVDALIKAEKLFIPVAKGIDTRTAGARLGQVLTHVKPDIAELAKRLANFLTRTLEFINESKRQALANRVQ